ncbi:hypothetical protein J5N97_001094 [Dioscorea zingiberensis]|uniref:Translation initiation factor beta propellor-like domain-containing protein n=1 Tax=Dioscorea zingiberensis TaxID=325984 RepID=A0A9D5BVE4_9LILI|nr:hypothetical protein J5N97_001094 [Dioscorea zingiberensis]
MAEVVSMANIEATSLRLGIGISSVYLNAIQNPSWRGLRHPKVFLCTFSTLTLICFCSDDDEDLYQEDGFEMEAWFGNIIVVDNLPVVPPEKYVATSVTSVHEMENGFHIWSFNGKLLYRIPKDHFCQFLWRPRPPSFLTAEKEEEISKNLKKYSKKYEGDDQDMSLLLSEQERRQRMMLLDEWYAWRENCKRLHEEEESELRQQQLRDVEASDEEEEYETEEVEVEEILDVKEEVVPFDLD